MRTRTKILAATTLVGLLGCSGLLDDPLSSAARLQNHLRMWGVDVTDASGDDLVACHRKGTLTKDEMAQIEAELEHLLGQGSLAEEDQEALRIFAERLIEQ